MLFPVIRCINFQQILVAHLRRSYYLPAAVSVVGGCRIFLSIHHVVVVIASCCRVIIDDGVGVGIIAYPPVVVADLQVDSLRVMQRILITIITMTVAITATIIPINININIEIRNSRFIALLVLVDIMDNLHSSRRIDVMLLDVLLVEL